MIRARSPGQSEMVGEEREDPHCRVLDENKINKRSGLRLLQDEGFSAFCREFLVRAATFCLSKDCG